MNRSTPQMRDFAERLIAHGTEENKSSGTRSPADFLVWEKLRPHLAMLMGNVGVYSLISRALAVSRCGVASLNAVQVKVDGSLEGLDELDVQSDPEQFAEGRLVLVTQLLGLLVAFIGEELTLRLVREAWPKLSLNDLDLKKREGNEKTK